MWFSAAQLGEYITTLVEDKLCCRTPRAGRAQSACGGRLADLCFGVSWCIIAQIATLGLQGGQVTHRPYSVQSGARKGQE